MVFIRHNASHWRTYVACGGLGLAVEVGFACQAQTLNPPVPSDGKGEGHHQKATTQKHQSGHTAYHSGQLFRPQSIVAEQAKSQDAVAPKTENKSYWYANPDWWVAWFTGLLFLATAGLWWFTALMWNETRKLGKDSVKASEAAVQSAKAMETMVSHTAQQATIAEQMFINANRPHLIFDQIVANAYTHFNPLTVPYFVFNFINFGSCPAIIKKRLPK